MEYEYDIAISFAGEDRSIADRLARGLTENEVRVFFDAFEEAQLWGENLYEYLHGVYSQKARFCVMLISQHYLKKAWTNHERKSAQERAFKENRAYILPVKLDDALIPGVLDTVGFISLKDKSIQDIINMSLAKLGKNVANIKFQNPIAQPSIPLPQLRKSFSERDIDVFFEKSFESIRSFFQQGIKELNNIADIEADLKDITSHKFLCRVYFRGNRRSACTVWLGSRFASNSICYSSEANPDAGSSINDSLFIEKGDFELSLKPLMNFSSSQVNNLNAEDAAKYFWAKLIAPLNN